jgi:hypothetical protein
MDYHTGVRIAEIGFLLMLFAGIWLVPSEIPRHPAQQYAGSR